MRYRINPLFVAWLVFFIILALVFGGAWWIAPAAFLVLATIVSTP